MLRTVEVVARDAPYLVRGEDDDQIASGGGFGADKVLVGHLALTSPPLPRSLRVLIERRVSADHRFERMRDRSFWLWRQKSAASRGIVWPSKCPGFSTTDSKGPIMSRTETGDGAI